MSVSMQFYREIINRKITLRLLEYYETGYVHMYEYAHWHKNIEICRMVAGECDFTVNGKDYHAKEGDIIVIGGGEVHTFKKRHGDCKIDICTFDPALLYKVFSQLGSISQHITKEQLLISGIDDKIDVAFSLMYDEYHKKDGGAKLLLFSNLLTLYGLLIRHFENKDARQGVATNKALLQKILEYIQEHYTERISLKTVADKFSYSPVYISSVFKACSGINFKYYLDNIRIIEAVELLSTSDMTVTEISHACGFDNIRTFNNVFKKITNKTPTDIKRIS